MYIFYILISYIVLLTLLILYLVCRVFQNTRSLSKFKPSKEYSDQIKKVIDAIEYNDKLLFNNQKYLYDIYNKNNNFTESNGKTFSSFKPSNGGTQHYNMSKSYTVLDNDTK